MQSFADKEAAASSEFSSSLDESSIQNMLDPVVEDASVSIDGIDRSMNQSTVYATATTSEGGSIQYKVTLARDGIGWKISNIELYFPSQN